MHQYLRAIGFSKLDKEDMKDLLEEIQERPDVQECAIDIEGNMFAELRYMVCDNVGLVVRGIFDENDVFIPDYYYPTFFGDTLSSECDVEIVKQTDKENYYVIGDELRLGVSMIFQLQNMADFLRKASTVEKGETRRIMLAALSCEGKIILPIYTNEKSRIKEKMNHDKRINLVSQAREGNEEAIESLTLDEIDLYSKISRRITREDILSLVTSYFMPFGIENDKYEILGEILEVNEAVNHITMEELYLLTINTNDVEIELCINKKDLLGQPEVGRRFKGSIWLQGTVDFS